MADDTPIVVLQEKNISLVEDETDIRVVITSSGANMVQVSSSGPQGPPGATGSGGGEEEMLDTEIDTGSTASTTYIGQAAPGTATTTSAWRIKRVVDSIGGTSIDWAGGSAEFIHAWSDRLSLSYGP